LSRPTSTRLYLTLDDTAEGILGLNLSSSCGTTRYREQGAKVFSDLVSTVNQFCKGCESRFRDSPRLPFLDPKPSYPTFAVSCPEDIEPFSFATWCSGLRRTLPREVLVVLVQIRFINPSKIRLRQTMIFKQALYKWTTSSKTAHLRSCQNQESSF